MARSHRVWSVLWVLLAIYFGRVRPAHADELVSYALIVGSNRGGEGQEPLSYAERDADSMAALMHELGRIPRERVVVLHEPSVGALQRAIDALHVELRENAASGRRAQVLFYYSGHARAHALSLAGEELPLDALRAGLLSLPATLTVVVLDACQSGAFSGVKGARAAADFSLSSVRDLKSSGIAVMASSTGSELSQESSELGSSFFTHNLLVSLRGAGDLDRDGRVSLDEAYRYAYQHTLVATARTQVGSQHATLETNLTGQGDVALSYPVDADARLTLPADVQGRVLVQHANGPVAAELVKAGGADLSLALPSGPYEVLVRGERDARSCALALQKGTTQTLELARCHTVELPEQQRKDAQGIDAYDRKWATESWFMEYGLNLDFQRAGSFDRARESHGYRRSRGGGLGPTAVLGMQLLPYLSVLARYDMLETGVSDRSLALYGSDGGDALWWRTQTVMGGVRLRYPFFGRWLVAFAEIDMGLALTRVRAGNYASGTDDTVHYTGAERHGFSYAVRGLVGATVNVSRHFGLFVATGYSRAPSVADSSGAQHDAGGYTVQTGLRFNGVRSWW